ncbi:MAG: hypothetical protein ACE5JZ_00265 [Kiloniellales bacterium]
MTPGSVGSRAMTWLPLPLFGAWPFLAFLNHNQEDALDYGASVLGLGAAYVVVLAVAALVAGLLFRRSARAPAVNALCVLTVMFFTYLPFSRTLAAMGVSLGTVRLSLWLICALGLAALAWRLSRFQRASFVAALMGALLVAMPGVQLAWFAAEGAMGGRAADAGPRVVGAQAESPPNVYWFVFDMYARADVLEAYLGYDNGDFLAALGRRGFFVADEAVANYSSTKLSLSTTVSMDYYLPVGPKLHPRLWTDRLQGYNAVVERFHQLGYRYIHAEPGGVNRKTRCGGREQQCISGPTRGVLGISEAEAGLLKLTPLYPVLIVLAPGLLSFDFTGLDDVIAAVRLDAERPHFLFAHILSPHPPARFGPGCRRLTRTAWELVTEDSPKTRTAYLHDLGCLNRLILEAIDEILARDRSDPILILQGDHGLKFGAAPAGASGMEPWLGVHGILHAMRRPERCRDDASSRFSTVNTFRIVFACIEETPLDLLANRVFRYRGRTLTELVADY